MAVSTDADRRSATRIPTFRYTSLDFHRREVERLWLRAWQVACREEDLPAPGNFVEYEIADQSILVIRGRDEVIRAFPNACRHRGTALVGGRGHRQELRCSFHAWCWDVEGRCTEIIDPHEFGNPPLSDFDLPSYGVGIWSGFVFVCPQPQVSFSEWIAPLAELVAPYGFEDMRYQFIKHTVVPCNWKVAVEAFLESYHLLGTHPQAVVSSDDTSTVYETHGEHGRFVVPLAVPSGRLGIEDQEMVLDQMIANMLAVQYVLPDQLAKLRRLQSGEERLSEGETLRDLLVAMNRERATRTGFDLSRFDDSQLFDNHEFHVFPNLVFSALPGEWFGFRFRPNGDDPHSCIFEVIDLRPPDSDHKAPETTHVPYSSDPEECLKAWGTILHQESLVAHFHETIDTYVGS